MDAQEVRADCADEFRDRRAMVAGTALIAAAILLLGMLHAVLIFESIGRSPQPSMWLRVPGSIVLTTTMLAAVVLLKVHRAARIWGALRLIVPAAAAASLARAGIFRLTGAWSGELTGLWLGEWFGGITICVCSAMLGFFYLRSQRALRLEERISGERATQRELALSTLETEEVRVRRSIAEGLHGSLQQRLVIQSIRLEIMIERATTLGVEAEILDGMRTLREEIDQIRENDVREMSRMLYPESIEIGMVPAIRALLRRLPPGIGTQLEVSDAVRDIDDPTRSVMSQAQRLLAVRFVEESVTNGLRHGRAGAFTVSVDVVDGTLVIEATNNGSAMEQSAVEAGSGLRRLRERFQLAGGQVEAIPAGITLADGDVVGAEHGVRLRAQLPIGGPGGGPGSPAGVEEAARAAG